MSSFRGIDGTPEVFGPGAVIIGQGGIDIQQRKMIRGNNGSPFVRGGPQRALLGWAI